MKNQTVLALVLLAGAAGCCRVPRPVTGPSSAPELVEVARGLQRELVGLRGELRVDHRGPAGRIAGKVYAFAASGGRLRLEAVSPMETPVRTLAVDGAGGTFTLSDHDERRCVRAPAEPCLVGQAVGVELGAEHVAAALAGAVPLLRHREAAARWHSCGYYELTLRGERPGWSQRVRLAPRDGELVATRAEVRGPDGVVLLVEHSGHRREGRLLVPARTRVRTPASGGDLLAEWRELEVGVELPASAWQARCPDGFSLETASCGSAGSGPAFEDVSPPEPPVEEAGAGDGGGGEGGEEGPGGEGPPGGDLGEELGLD